MHAYVTYPASTEQADIDLFGKRSAEEYTVQELTQYTRFYSIRLDDDLDGYADSVMTYTKETNVIEYTIDFEHETLVGLYALRLIPETDLGEFLDISKFDEFEEKFDEDLRQKLYNNIDGYNHNYKFIYLRDFSALYVETTHLEHINSNTEETLTYDDMEEGEIIETRYYADNFVDDRSLFIAEEDVETFTIVDLDTRQQIDATNILINASQLEWSTNTWGIDNVPIKFDTVTTVQGDTIDISHVNERTIYINIDNRYSLFYDHLQSNLNEVRNGGVTTFKVTGVLLTPLDGKVYYTSDKELFQESSTHDEAKTTGHYLYYDSDSNGFWETVFVLTPDYDGDNTYDVISIGYNYDGSHDFIPYAMVEMSTELFGTIHFTGQVDSIDYGVSWRLDPETPLAIDSLYPKETSDGIGTKDQIFEIYRLKPNSFENNRDLYIDVKQKQYAKAYHSYREGLWADVAQQVVSTTASGIGSIIVGSMIASWLAPFAFAGIYFLFALSSSSAKKREMKARLQARTFYSAGMEKTGPKRLNKMLTSDFEREGLVAANLGHPGGYYSTVYGGVPGDMYDAEIITSPPATWRAAITEEQNNEENWEMFPDYYDYLWGTQDQDGKQWTNFNLDYSLITSELPALADTLNSIYSSGQNFFNITLNIDSESRVGLYNAYRENTIGYVEQKVKIASNGQFDAIRPGVINGIPQYTFINSQDDFYKTTQPLTPLYSPIIVSQFRYDQLLYEGKCKDTVMTIDVDGMYGSWPKGDGFNAYQLHPAEAEQYKAKIPLSPTEFNYPVTNIIIDVKHPFGGIVKSVDVASSEYTIIDGNLYFNRTLEEIVFTSKDEWEELSVFFYFFNVNLDYDVHVYFATIVPYAAESGRNEPDSTVNTPSGPITIDLSQYSLYVSSMDAYYSQYIVFASEIIDTTSSDSARTVLAQTTSYAISDYFNQYQMGYTDGTNKAERDYTVLVTFWSTLISTVVLLPITAGVAAIKNVVPIKEVIASQAIKIIPGVISEIFEELYVDPYIEAWISARFYEAGGDMEAADLLSMVVTSFREAVTGGVTSLLKGATKAGFNLYKGKVDVSPETILTSQLVQAQQQLADINSWSALKTLKSVVTFDNLVGIVSAIPSFFLGGAGIGIMSLGLDLSTDAMQTKLKNHYLKGILPTRIETLAEALAAEKERSEISKKDQADIKWIRAEVKRKHNMMNDPKVQIIPQSSLYALVIPQGNFIMDQDAINDAKKIKEEFKRISSVFYDGNVQWSKLESKVSDVVGFYSKPVSNGGELGNFQGFYRKELIQLIEQFSYTELLRIDQQLQSLSELEYNGEEIYFESIGVYGTINPNVLGAIFTKLGNKESLTNLEQQIVDISALIMGGPTGPATTNLRIPRIKQKTFDGKPIYPSSKRLVSQKYQGSSRNTQHFLINAWKSQRFGDDYVFGMVYKWTNRITGKSYVGRTQRTKGKPSFKPFSSLSVRFDQEIKLALRGSLDKMKDWGDQFYYDLRMNIENRVAGSTITDAIRDTMELEIIEIQLLGENFDADTFIIKELETLWINELRRRGEDLYNVRGGGAGSTASFQTTGYGRKDLHEKIIYLLSHGFSSYKIAEYIGLSRPTTANLIKDATNMEVIQEARDWYVAQRAFNLIINENIYELDKLASYFRGMSPNDMFIALASPDFPAGNEYLKGWLTARYLRIYGGYSFYKDVFYKSLYDMGITSVYNYERGTFHKFIRRESLYEYYKRGDFISPLRSYAKMVIKDFDTVYGFLHHLGLFPEIYFHTQDNFPQRPPWELDHIVIDLLGFDFDTAQDIYYYEDFRHLLILING